MFLPPLLRKYDCLDLPAPPTRVGRKAWTPKSFVTSALCPEMPEVHQRFLPQITSPA